MREKHKITTSKLRENGIAESNEAKTVKKNNSFLVALELIASSNDYRIVDGGQWACSALLHMLISGNQLFMQTGNIELENH